MYRIFGIMLVAAMFAIFVWKNEPTSTTVTVETATPVAQNNPFSNIKAE